MSTRVLNTEKAPKAIGPYVQGKIVNGFLFASGQIPLDPATGEMVQGDITAQAEQTMQNVAALVGAAGTTMDNIVKATCYLKNIDDFAAFNEVYSKYFTSKPARSCVAVKTLPKGVLCEIEAIAVMK